MRDEIRQLQQRLGLTVAYVTHDQNEALAVSDQIIVMEAGEIAQAGTPQDLYERPHSAFVAGFMGEAVLFDGQSLPDGAVQLGPLRLLPRHTLAPGAVRAAVRPEAWLVGREFGRWRATPSHFGGAAHTVRLFGQPHGADVRHRIGYGVCRLA